MTTQRGGQLPATAPTDEATPWAHFDDTRNAWREAAATAGVVDRDYLIAGHPVRLRFAGVALESPLTRALAHLQTDNGAEPSLTVCTWDTASTGVPAPRQGWLTSDSATTPRTAGSPRLRAMFQPGETALSVLDSRIGLGFFWTNDARVLPYYETAAPLRAIFHWWMSANDRQFVHGGAVGTEAGGVLLAGRGGSGKSTTSLASITSSLRFAGDDFVLATAAPTPWVYSLYSSAKLDTSQLARFPQFSGSVANADRLPAEKGVVYVHEHSPRKTSSGFPLRGVLVPRIRSGQETSIQPAPAAEIFRAIAPSTVAQLVGGGQDALAMMARLVEQLPTGFLELGQDLDAIAPVITEFLASQATP